MKIPDSVNTYLKKIFRRDDRTVRRGTHGSFVSGALSGQVMMLHVIGALLPVVIWSVYLFGARVISVIAVSVLSCVGVDTLMTLLISGKPETKDLTAVVTGLLLALTLPAATPLWIPAVGGVIAVIPKQIFGGTGKNIFNPALFARTFIMLVFGNSIFFTAPFEKLPLFANVDGAIATPAAMSYLNDGRFPNESVFDLLFGKCVGNIGEVSAILILIGGAVLIFRGVISYRIPVSFVLTVAVITYIFPKIDIDSSYAVYSILSGGVLIAAFFMATDPVTSPCTPFGQLIYGIGCGAVTVLFRYSGLFYDGAYPAVIIMNELSRPLDLLSFKLFGPVKKHSKKKQEHSV